MNKRRPVELVFSIVALGVFLVCAAVVSVMSAKVYDGIVGGMDSAFNLRNSLSFAVNKVRQADEQDGISIGKLEGTPALVLKTTLAKKSYISYIYYYNGALREANVENDIKPTLQSGKAVADVADFSVERESHGVYTLTAKDNGGRSMSVMVLKRSGSEVGIQHSDIGVPESELID